MRTLVLGSGGREHTLAWKIAKSPNCEELFIAPGNAGTSFATNVDLQANDFEGIARFISENAIDLLVVGPEDPLVNGIRDYLLEKENLQALKIIGPGKSGARLEGSKDFTKEFLVKNQIPTAASKTFRKETLHEGLEYLKTRKLPIVLKADGLAAGKGVIISDSYEEASESLRDMLVEERFGAASQQVLIEDFLSGIEVSAFVLTDGKDYILLPEAKDYKRIYEDDQGPNTGGMGAVSPVPFADEVFLNKVKQRIIEPTINGLQRADIPYIGFIFIGLMNVAGDPYVIEYNVRMGDPETQVVLPRIKNDLLEVLDKTATGKLGEVELELVDESAVTIVMASQGYPSSYTKGHPISGLDPDTDELVFHAGTKNAEGTIVTNGGRVLAVTGMGSSTREAIAKAYQGVAKIHWEGAQYRQDIGKDILSLLEIE